ncbi:23S rRNA (adenine(2030)-N(6))-methyltransferase RlmJ [Pseudoroseicyclus tamaricis]|uniref:Ribosomal RNA large subunit methyltransferase J n=1 Tax=Pseudoroseicyclus tamaricis TaxID=2705421 RepID=A0A6B2JT21_9RHOB|nr:23S rRNA (adenine(2030)-N(6))-methyltransferase RlmJ [Pseudoroseicyclus tamaricis]NDV01707.1 23S rRNA (adenine(2030)-N(6))-methyltransferase RlmJ [Pseudoroseicyclus tamaricis]
MLSYQHGYHAGNGADVMKHAALSWILDYLTQKPKPLTYVETHAGRGLYDLAGVEARKTGEAEAGIVRAEALFEPDHPYRQVLDATRATHGPDSYPGSPLVAAHFAREQDRLHMAELHPQEHAALVAAMGERAEVVREDGAAFARRLLPPEPARGLVLIDPSYEVKADYAAMAALVKALHKRWPVGIKMLWYPMLEAGLHAPMAEALDVLEGAQRIETPLRPARPGHRMLGSGLILINAPWGFEEEAARIAAIMARV